MTTLTADSHNLNSDVLSVAIPVFPTMAPASTPRRVMAYFLDQLLISCFYIPVLIPTITQYWKFGLLEISITGLIACFAVQFLFRWSCLYLMGATPGKLMLGLRVVNLSEDRDGHSLGVFQSFLRVLADHLSIFFSHGLRSLALIRLDRRHVSDWIAETQVVDVEKMYGAFTVKRNWIVALILCWYFSTQGLYQAYDLIRTSKVLDGKIFIELAE